ncbi:MAG: hypothetical protein VB023_09650 [Oscillibacter sp.]|nr:hypothetical protein [Oscillibacter sp.]
MENVTFAKVMGMSVTDDGIPDYGYVKLEGVRLQRDTLARLLGTTPDTIVIPT